MPDKSLYGNATQWGLIAAKHDHVAENIALVNEAVEELGYLGHVLTAEHDGLAFHNASMMGGGYTMLGWIHSVQLKGVTHARVSADYACWYNKSTGIGEGCLRGMNGNYWDFNTGPPSMLSWALGILPYKDSFFSNGTVRGSSGCTACLYTNWSEPYPWVHAAVSALSAGPQAPGDRIGAANTSLVMRSCSADGILMKPDRPATPIDSYWSVRAFGAAATGPRGELWSTETVIPGSNTAPWLYAFGTMLASPYELTLDELMDAATSWPDNYANGARGKHKETHDPKHLELGSYVAWDFWSGPSTATVLKNSSSTLYFPAGVDYGAARLITAAPVLSNGWAVLGETSKFIAMSRQRFSELTVQKDGGVRIQVAGVLRERVSITVRDPGGQIKEYECSFTSSGEATLVLPSGQCA